MKKEKFKSFGSAQVERYFECGWSRCSSHHIFYQNNEISHLICTLLSWNMFLYHFEKVLVAGSVFIVDSHCSSAHSLHHIQSTRSISEHVQTPSIMQHQGICFPWFLEPGEQSPWFHFQSHSLSGFSFPLSSRVLQWFI